MDQELLQGLTQIFQQGLQLLQQAQQGGGGAMSPGQMGDDDMGGDDEDPSAPPAGMPGGGMMGGGMPGGDDGDGMDPSGMDGGDTLHDRVSALEGHTGLKKAARGSMGDRLDALEDEILGQQYDGPMALRVRQLEKALGGVPRQQSLADTAPEEIPLDALIKAAVEQAVGKQGQNGGLPSVSSLRKSANQAAIGRRSQAPNLQGDAELIKAANQWGMGDDLDEPVSFGDALMMQYRAATAGIELPDDED